MEAEVGRQLQEAGIEASDDTLSDFCQFLKENHETNTTKKRNKTGSKNGNKRKPKKVKKMGPSSKNPNEVNEWEERLTKWENKVQALELQLKACEEMETRAASESKAIRMAMETDPLRAYPYLSRDITKKGGFIHPPTYQEACRSRFPIYKNEVYKRPPDFILQYRENERKNRGYIPGPMNRQDDLRWKIKERIIYSHPDYFIRK